MGREKEVNSDELELLRARYIAIRAKNREDLEKAYAILERLEKKGWSLQSEMDEEEWTEISYRKTQILKNVTGGNTVIIGIDLGTTNSLAAYYTEHGPEIIPNRLGERLTPSVVSIDENDQVYVGKTARERMAVYPGQTADLFKRSMEKPKKNLNLVIKHLQQRNFPQWFFVL